MKKNPKIFISYAWKDNVIADEIDNAFKNIGITLTRDVRDVAYKGNLEKYMQGAREHNYILMLISDSFLKSVNCLYEVLEVFKEKDFEKRILQIILKDANIYSSSGRLEYIQYWEKKYEEIKTKASGSSLKNIATTASELNHLDTICNNIGKFLDFLSRELSVAFETIKESNYQPILDYIDYPKSELLKELSVIQQIKNLDEQEIEIDRFILDNPQYYHGYFVRGMIKSNRGEDAKAITDYSWAIKLNSEYPIAYINRGFCFASIGNFKDSIQDLNESIKLDPKNHVPYLNRGAIFHNQGLLDEAISDYTNAINLNPADKDLFTNRGIVLKQKGEYLKAIDDFTEAIKLNPESESTYTDRALSFALIGEYRNAIDDLTKAIMLKPNYAKAYLLRANAYESISEIDDAIEDYENGVKLDPKLANDINRVILSPFLDRIINKK